MNKHVKPFAKTLSFICALQLATSVVSCADSQQTMNDMNQLNGIIGGTVPAADSIAKTSTVAIGTFNKAKGRFSSFCTGVVISKDFILTAAHCMEDEKLTSQNGSPSVLLYFGNAYENYDKNLERVSTKWEVNDKYEPIYEPEFGMVASALGDVALLKVDGGIPTSALPIKIGINHNLKKDEKITAAGWGLTYEKEEENVGYLVGVSEEDVNPQAKNPSNDEEIEGSTDRLYQTQISFISYWKTHLVFQQSKQTGVCRGDSGGPAYYKTKEHGTVVIGTVRGGHGFSDCSGLVEYTNLTNNIEFIKKASLKLTGTEATIVNLRK